MKSVQREFEPISHCHIESVSNESRVQINKSIVLEINQSNMKSLQNTINMNISDLTVPTESVIYGIQNNLNRNNNDFSRFRMRNINNQNNFDDVRFRKKNYNFEDDSLNVDLELLNKNLRSKKNDGRFNPKQEQTPNFELRLASPLNSSNETGYKIIVNNAPVFYKIKYFAWSRSVLDEIGALEGKKQNEILGNRSGLIPEQRIVCRRFSDFFLLRKRLESLFEFVGLPEVGGKTGLGDLFKRNWEVFYSRRKICLQVFLKQILALQSFFKDYTFFTDFFNPVNIIFLKSYFCRLINPNFFFLFYPFQFIFFYILINLRYLILI